MNQSIDSTGELSTHPVSYPALQKDDQIVIAGAGGFIGGALTRFFIENDHTNLRAVDKKPLRCYAARSSRP